MGQKVHPIKLSPGHLQAVRRSRYYAGRELPALLREDELLLKYLKARLGHAATADIVIERKPGKVVVTLHTGRPGVVIGTEKGAEVDKLRDELAHLSGKRGGRQCGRDRASRVPDLPQAGGRQHCQSVGPAHFIPPRYESARCRARCGWVRRGSRSSVAAGWVAPKSRASKATTRGGCRCIRCARGYRLRDLHREDHLWHHWCEGCGSSRARSWKIAAARPIPPACKGHVERC